MTLASSVPDEVPVLIVGGGPIGLALAANLGRRGVQTLLVEHRPDALGSAKMIQVSVRTMELCRQLGLSQELREWGFPIDYSLDGAFVTSLNGYELGRVRTPTLRQASIPQSPERDRPCPQTWFDPILQRCARSFPSIEMAYETRLESLRQDTEGVDAVLEEARTGIRRSVRARYLIGCDGYSSTVRHQLGIPMRGQHNLGLSMSVYLRIPNLDGEHDKEQAIRYVVLGADGVWAVLTSIDGRELYRLQLISVPKNDLETVDIAAAMRRLMGKDISYTVEDKSSWTRKMVVADRFSDGRVFIAGDASHSHPPNGGLGMNTGIQDSFDLGWKIPAVLEGWGGPSLLASYDVERRSASARAAAMSLDNFNRLVADTSHPWITDTTATADRARAELGATLVERNTKAWQPLGVHLGYIYHPSPIVEPDGTTVPVDDLHGYVPTTFPGARAPHIWLDKDRSILDLFGHGFVLLTFGENETTQLEAAAAKRSVPIQKIVLHNRDAAALYERKLVLVRPDGHVAWRGDHLPANPSHLIETIRGAGPPISASRA